MRTLNRARPAFFELYRIKFPVTAMVSLGHRISGVVLALALPFSVWLLALALDGPRGFDAAAAALGRVDVRIVVVLLAWALAHHALAGVRHLMLDMHIGTSLRAARASAVIVFVLQAAIVIAVVGMLL